jgi:hypothetical protein
LDTRFGATPEVQATYLNELKARISGRSPDDKKEATKLAVETAKMLITVGIAVLVAAGTMLQFARSGGLGWQSPTIICFGVAVAFLIASMTSGFSAIIRFTNKLTVGTAWLAIRVPRCPL